MLLIVVKKLHQRVQVVINSTRYTAKMRKPAVLLFGLVAMGLSPLVSAESDLCHAALNRLANTGADNTFQFESNPESKDWLTAVLNKEVVLPTDEPSSDELLRNRYAFDWNRQDLGSKVKRDYEIREKNVLRKLVGDRWSNHVDVDIRKRPKIELEFGFD